MLDIFRQSRDGIHETSNNFCLIEGNVILLVDRCEKGGTQFDGVEQCIYTHKQKMSSKEMQIFFFLGFFVSQRISPMENWMWYSPTLYFA